jgi:hypothetical protein
VERKPIDEIVASLPVKPNEVDHQGSAIYSSGTFKYRTNKKHEQDCLSYFVKNIFCSFLEEEIDGLVETVLSVKSILDKEMPNYESSFSVACYTNGQHNPEIIITPTTVTKLASLNARIWIDVYCSPDE